MTCPNSIEYQLLEAAASLVEAAAKGNPDTSNIKAVFKRISDEYQAKDDALENIRYHASRHYKQEWAKFVLQCCSNAGNIPQTLRTK